MVTISHIVNKLIDERIYLYEALSHGIAELKKGSNGSPMVEARYIPKLRIVACFSLYRLTQFSSYHLQFRHGDSASAKPGS